jgi:hypothetical protein
MTSETQHQLGCDTADMLMIHRLFRWLFGDAPGLVRGVAAGDTERSGVVGDHVEQIAAGLHLHHHGEDLLLWDRLESRAPGCALHVSQMRAQHQTIAALLDEVGSYLPAWRSSASAEDRDRLAEALDRVLTALTRHLGQEEEQIVPVAAISLTQSEWDQLGEHGMSQVPRERLMIQLGAMLESMPPQERAGWLKANVPPLARLLWALLGKRQYADYRRRVYGEPAAA